MILNTAGPARPTTPFPGGLADDCAISFEVFPPRTPAAEQALWSAIGMLAPIAPRFISVTCGAGGSTRDGTNAVARRIQRDTGLAAAAHLTCAGLSRDAVDTMAREHWDAGVRHIVALRGDLAPNAVPHPDGYADAAALVAGLRQLHPFEISVAAYPEGHPASPNRAADLDSLWRKIDAGATRAITQFFFSAECFFRFRDQVAALGLRTEIVPGILPVTSAAGARSFAARCGATIPPPIDRLLDGIDERPAVRDLVATTIATDLCRELHAGGVRHFHFYTLNRAELSYSVCHLLGFLPRDREERSRAA